MASMNVCTGDQAKLTLQVAEWCNYLEEYPPARRPYHRHRLAWRCRRLRTRMRANPRLPFLGVPPAESPLTAIDSLFMVRSYAASPARRTAMDNRINEIRKRIRALRVSMLEAEAIMHEQINRDEECSFVAGEILKMCAVMSVLAREKESLGDREPILVDGSFLPRRLPMAPRPLALRPVKRSLVPAEQRAG
jgi:hypothetical protein